MRISDLDGALWPVTGHRCPVCQMPSDAANEGRQFLHMFCEPPGSPLSPTEHAAVLRMIAETLGGEVIRERPFDRWLVSGAALPSASSTPAADPLPAAIAVARSDAELTELWRQHRDTWTDTHTAAVKRRLTQLGA